MSLPTSFSRFSALAGAAVLITSLAACGSGASSDTQSDAGAPGAAATTALSGELAGAGASSQEAAMEAWKAGFAAVQPDVAVSYDAVGSGAGITQFADSQVLWAGSDAPLEGEEIEAARARCASPAWALPVYISPVAVIFNLEGVDALNLDAATIAKIFTGEIAKWNDPAIVASNPGVELPDLAITPVHRSDKSGTTENFTDYLHEAAPEAWAYDPAKEWPIEGGESGDKTAGVVQAVTEGAGAIGYADASQAGDLAPSPSPPLTAPSSPSRTRPLRPPPTRPPPSRDARRTTSLSRSTGSPRRTTPTRSSSSPTRSSALPTPTRTRPPSSRPSSAIRSPRRVSGWPLTMPVPLRFRPT